MKKINYISVAYKSSNSGDEYIEKCFYDEFNNYDLHQIAGGHEDMRERTKELNVDRILMSSSNMLPQKSDYFKNLGPWKIKGYTKKNIIPVSMGTGPTGNEWDISILYKMTNLLLPIKLLLIFFAITLTPSIKYIYNLFFFNKKIAVKLIKGAINPIAPIACRTKAAEDYLNELGYQNTFYTGCVTLWSFNQIVIDKIDNKKKKKLVLAFTDESLEVKQEVVNQLRKFYDEIIVWHQSYTWSEDVIADQVIDNDWKKLEEIYKSGEYEFIGSRLHAGIFALKCGVRSFFVAIDHRVVNYSKKIGIRYIMSNNWATAFDDGKLILEEWSETLKPIDMTIIDEYKSKINDYLG